MKYFVGLTLVLTLAGCGSKVFDARGEKGDTGAQGPQGIQGPNGENGQDGSNGTTPSLVYLCHVQHGKHGQEHNLYVPQDQVSNFLANGDDYLGECN